MSEKQFLPLKYFLIYVKSASWQSFNSVRLCSILKWSGDTRLKTPEPSCCIFSLLHNGWFTLQLFEFRGVSKTTSTERIFHMWFRKNASFHQTPHRINRKTSFFWKTWKCQKANSFLSVKIIRLHSVQKRVTQCNVFFWNHSMDGDGMLISLCQKMSVNIVDKGCGCWKTNCA